MRSQSDVPCEGISRGKGQRTPFAQLMVKLSKEEVIELLQEAIYWKSQHQQVVARMAQMENWRLPVP